MCSRALGIAEESLAILWRRGWSRVASGGSWQGRRARGREGAAGLVGTARAAGPLGQRVPLTRLGRCVRTARLPGELRAGADR